MVRESLLILIRSRGCSPEDAAIADATGEPVLVEALEQELGIAPADSEEVAKAGKGDLARGPALTEDNVRRDLVRACTDRVSSAQPDELPARLEEAGELVVADLRGPDPGGGELALEGSSIVGSGSEGRDCAR